jgi:class 3 adenylate cyclase/tetratricopeptide (TPR) repeat protein
MSEPLRCPACQTPVVPGARFCFQCGASLDTAAPARADEVAGAERRVVTVLFGDLSDFTAWAEDLDPERVKVVTDRVLAALAHAVQLFGGHVDKLTGDGIMAVFGAPTAHEDDAERAVRAAGQMQRSVSRLVAEEAGGGQRLGLRVGVNTGEVLAGVQARLSYTVVGDTVNTAARLSDSAGVGAVLAGRETAAATTGIASWRALPPLRLKGKREPVPAFELLALRPRGASRIGLGDEVPLTGREAELGRLVSALMDAVETGRPGRALVTGEAGVGKTRLTRELTRFASELPGARVLVGRCPPYGEMRDLVPLVEIVRTACGITPDDDAAAVERKVRRAIARLEHPSGGGPAGSPLADRLLTTMGILDEGGTFDAATPGDASRAAADATVVEALSALLAGLARTGPVVVVVDDLHWARPALLSTVADVVDRLSGPVFVIGAGREVAVPARRARPDLVHVALRPLDPTASARLLRSYLGGATLDPTVRDALLDRAQGNPFFLAELLHLLVDRGLLRREGDAWLLDGPLPDSVLPAGVQAVLAARIDSLDAGPKAALRAAAVVGPTFWVAGVAALTGLDVATAAQRVEDLVRRDIVRPRGSSEAHTFVHTLTREVAYASVPKADRARLHAAAATWAAGGMPGTPAEVDAAVAGHAERAVRLVREMGLTDGVDAWGAVPVGFAALLRLGRLALARDQNVAAENLLTRALDLGESGVGPADLIAARVARAQALVGVFRLDEAIAEASAVVDEAPPRLRAAALTVVGEVRRKQGDDAGAIGAFVQAMSTASEAGDDRIASEAIRQLGLIDYFAGRLASAERRFTDALELAERVGDRRAQGWALQHLAWSATTLGDYDRADAMLARGSQVFAALEDTGGLAWCAGTEAFVRLLQGRLGAARELVAAVLPSARAVGDTWSIGALLDIESLAATELGDLAAARVAVDEAREIFAELRDAWCGTITLIAQGAIARAAGEHDVALPLFVEAVHLAERAGQATAQVMALVSLGWCAHDVGDLDGAETAGRRALEIAERVGLAGHAEAGIRVLLALVARGRGDLGSALTTLAAVTASTEAPTWVFPMRQAVAHHAGTLLQAGRVDDAVATARRALTVPAEDVRSRVVALRALGAALAAAGRSDEARARLEEALALSRSTGHRLEEPATEAALARL